MTTRLQLRRSLAVTAAICAISAPAAGAAQDLRSPDSRDASATQTGHAREDLGSPDDRDAAAVRIAHGLRSPDTRVRPTGDVPRDLRSPDTRDAATGGAKAFGALTPAWPVSTSAPSPEPVASRHDDQLPWVLGAALGLIGCAVVIRHGLRRRQRVAV